MTTRVPVERGSCEVIRRVFTHGRRDASHDVSIERGTSGGMWQASKASRASKRACVRACEWTSEPASSLVEERPRGDGSNVFTGISADPRGGLSARWHSRCPAGYILAAAECKRPDNH